MKRRMSLVVILAIALAGLAIPAISASAATIGSLTTAASAATVHSSSHLLKASSVRRAQPTSHQCAVLRRAFNRPGESCSDFIGVNGSGTSTVGAVRFTADAGQIAQIAATSVPHTCSTYYGTCEASFNPRVNCGGFNGNVEWSWEVVGTGSAYWIQIWGQVWSTCASTSSVWLSFTAFPSSFNHNSGSASAYGTSGVNWTHYSYYAPGNISVTVCNTYGGGWHCGTPQTT